MKKKSRFLQWFRNQKLWKKIIYTFLLASIIPMAVAQILILTVITQNMEDNVNEYMRVQLGQIAERTNLTLDVYTNLVYQIYSDNQLIDYVSSYHSVDSAVKSKAYRKICDRLQQYGITSTGIECISIILPDGQDITYDFGMASAVNNIWDSYGNMCSIMPYQAAQNETNMVITPTSRFTVGNKEKMIFHISKQMYNLKNMKEGSIATVVLSVNESVLNTVCNAGLPEDRSNAYAINFIMDKQNNILTYPNAFYSGIKLKDGRNMEEFVHQTGELKNKKIEVNCYEDAQLGWRFYNIYDRDYILRDVTKTQTLTIIIGAFLFLISILLIAYTVRLIEQSTEKIVAGIKEVQQGNLKVQIQVDSEDEMGQIADNFNTMTEKVQDLIQEVTDATSKQKNAEIIALEAQINPHFLYNTLDSINWMAIEKEEYQISEMIRNLSVILRYSVNKSNHMVTIAQMFDWLQKYVSLQRLRFNNAFECETYVEPAAEQLWIHKLLIQPFVENAIIHGFKGIDNGGILRVDCMLSEDRAYITVIIEDNGVGMSKELTDRYNDPIMAVKDDGRSIGLQNAFSRMKMYYGEKANWDVHSIENIGTVITLKIPVQKTGEK